MTTKEAHAIPFVHPAYVRSVLDCLNTRGVAPSAVLTSAGLGWHDLGDGQCQVELSVFRRVAAHATQLAGEPALGMLAGSMLQPYHTPVGIAAVTSLSFGDGLGVIAKYANLIFNTFDFQLEDGLEWNILRVRPIRALCETHVFVTHSILGAICRLIEAMNGPQVSDLIVGLPASCFTGNSRGRAYLPTANLVFDQPCLSFHIRSRALLARCPSADATVSTRALESCEKLKGELGQSTFVQRVRRALLDRLDANPPPSEVAFALNVSPRILMRRLASAGLSYSEIKNDLRKDQAIWYLRHSELSIESIAERIGYVNSTDFSRKFKCWFNTAPTRMRQTFRSD